MSAQQVQIVTCQRPMGTLQLNSPRILALNQPIRWFRSFRETRNRDKWTPKARPHPSNFVLVKRWLSEGITSTLPPVSSGLYFH